jgi:hypothetical protein
MTANNDKQGFRVRGIAKLRGPNKGGIVCYQKRDKDNNAPVNKRLATMAAHSSAAPPTSNLLFYHHTSYLLFDLDGQSYTDSLCSSTYPRRLLHQPSSISFTADISFA